MQSRAATPKVFRGCYFFKKETDAESSSLDELSVLRAVNMLTNECLDVGGTINPCEPAIKHELGHPGCRLDLNFEDVGLRRIEHAQFQLLGRDLVGDCVCGFDEHSVGHALCIGGVNGHTDGGEDIKVVGLRRQKRLAVEVDRWELHAPSIKRLTFRPGVSLLG